MTQKFEHSVQLVDILRADFRTSAGADRSNTELQHALDLPFRYHPARLAIAVSLSDPSPPPIAPDATGRPIKGETLFGQDELDLAMWTGLIVEHAAVAAITRRQLQDLVSAHWQRGVAKLWLIWTKSAGQRDHFFIALAGSPLAEPCADA